MKIKKGSNPLERLLYIILGNKYLIYVNKKIARIII